jgi:hypothetical protein
MRTFAMGTHKAWQKRFDSHKLEKARNPFGADEFRERHTIQITMVEVQEHRKKTGHYPDVLSASAAIHRLYAFAAMFTNVYDRLPAPSQKIFAGRLRGGLKDDVGLNPLAFELLIASHLMQMKADVEWHDLGTGGFDFVVRRGGSEAEVECKTFSADVGRSVHQRRVYQLGDAVHGDISDALDSHGSFLADVVVEGHFTGKIVEGAANSLRAALRSRTDVAGPSPCSVAFHRLSRSNLPPRLQSGKFEAIDVSEFVAQRLNLHNQSLLAVFRVNKGFAIIVVRSSKSDDVTGGIYAQLKDGTRQFSGNRPAILCGHLLDLSPEQILELYRAQQRGERSGINHIATRLFKGNRPFLHSIYFTSPGSLQRHEEIRGDVLRNNVRESGLSFAFMNPDHPAASNKSLQFFSV